MAESCWNDELEIPEKRDELIVHAYIRPINNNLFYNNNDNNNLDVWWLFYIWNI